MPAIDRNLLQEGASLQGQIVAVWAHTGRGLRLAETERAKVLECWRNSVPAPRLVIAAAGGSPGMADPGQVILSARSMARRALDLGADAVLVHPPTAFRDRPDRDTLVLDYHATIAEVGLPLILFYLHEEAGGVHYGTETLSRWLERPEVVGIKVATLDSVITFQDLASLIEAVAPGKVLLPRQERSSQTGNHGTTPPYGPELPPGRTRKEEVDSDSLFRGFRWIPWLISDPSGAAIGCCWTDHFRLDFLSHHLSRSRFDRGRVRLP